MIFFKPEQRRGDAGFTLLEMIAALALVALAVSLVMPRLSASRQSLRLRTLAVEMASNMKIARTEAMKTNTDTVFVLDTTNRSYSAAGAVPKKQIPREITVSFESQAAESNGPSRAGFRFRPDGTASGGSIKLQTGANTTAISVDWLTGAVTLRGQ